MKKKYPTINVLRSHFNVYVKTQACERINERQDPKRGFYCNKYFPKSAKN